MSIRSENNKIMLKIESMASRNERLVNISRKFPFKCIKSSSFVGLSKEEKNDRINCRK